MHFLALLCSTMPILTLVQEPQSQYHRQQQQQQWQHGNGRFHWEAPQQIPSATLTLTRWNVEAEVLRSQKAFLVQVCRPLANSWRQRSTCLPLQRSPRLHMDPLLSGALAGASAAESLGGVREVRPCVQVYYDFSGACHAAASEWERAARTLGRWAKFGRVSVGGQRQLVLEMQHLHRIDLQMHQLPLVLGVPAGCPSWGCAIRWAPTFVGVRCRLLHAQARGTAAVHAMGCRTAWSQACWPAKLAAAIEALLSMYQVPLPPASA